MRRTCLLCCCLLATATAAYSQSYLTNFNSLSTQPCPYDPTQTVSFPSGWIIYQTLDGTWDGAVDVSRCISAEAVPGGDLQIDLGQINPDEPLFVRALPSELSGIGELPVNALMVVDFFMGAGPVALGSTCVEDICSGVLMGIDVGVPGAMRIHTGLIPDNFYEIHSCFPTEYFPGQHLRELILKITFLPGSDLTGHYVNLYGITLEQSYSGVGLVSAIEASSGNYNAATQEYDVSAFEASNGSGGFGDQYLMVYTAPTFPSLQNPSYVTGNVNPPSAQQQTINLDVDEYQTLEIQPFTQIRGELVEGSDSIRHLVNLVNNGSDFCVNFLDLIFSGGNQYRHGKGGRLTMNNSFSCFQFRKGSALRVMEGATLEYGNNGSGMLAICANSGIILERNATLVVDAILNIAECDNALPPSHIYVDLPKGAQLIFTENAHLTNRFSQGQQMELRVRMLGGTLDDSRLSAQDRALIRRIYPEPSADFAANFAVSPNPFDQTPRLSYLSENAEELTLQWISLEGKVLSTAQLSAQSGSNEWELPNTPTGAGCYGLRVGNGHKNTVLKVIKME